MVVEMEQISIVGFGCPNVVTHIPERADSKAISFKTIPF